MVTIIAFLVIFGIVVIAHEFGHFLLAKRGGIKVVEFSVGMGPTIFKFYKGGTRYALKLLPIGGACMFEGEDGIYEEKEDGKSESGTLERPEGSFQEASPWVRLSSVFAGPLFNLLLAFFLSMIVVGYAGVNTTEVVEVSEGYPAKEAGIQSGDVITRVNGSRVHLFREISIACALNSTGKDITVEYERDGQKMEAVLQPQYNDQQGMYMIGITGGVYDDCRGLSVVSNGYYWARYWVKYTMTSLKMLVTGNISKDDVSGPVGVAAVIGDVIEESSPEGFLSVLMNLTNFAVLLSVNLGILNLLPLPALDGGRIVFILLEIVRGKPVPPEKEGMVHFIGFVALMILMVFVLYNDIARLFQ